MKLRSLDKLRMSVIETSTHGIVGRDTIFAFSQIGNEISAEYSGGAIIKGFLVGKRMEDRLEFSYCQLHADGTRGCGRSTGELSISPEGIMRMVEHFEWQTRPGKHGQNVFEGI